MTPIQHDILKALSDAGGELPLDRVEAMYHNRGRKGDAHFVAGMNRRKWTEYTRSDPRANATGLRILHAGRMALSTVATKATP